MQKEDKSIVRSSVLAVCGLVIVVAAALGGIYLVETEAAPTPCELVDRGRSVQLCAVAEVWSGLKQQAENAPAVTAQSANIAAARSAANQANQLWQTGFVPLGRKVQPWPFQLPVDWNADPFNDRNWRYQLHAWRMLDPLFGAWEQTGEIKYLDDTLRVVFDWYEYHEVRQQKSDYEWYDMAVGLRAMKLAYLFQRAFEGDVQLDDAGKEKLIHLAWLHAQSLMDKNLLSKGNHGLFQLHGLLALCNVVPSIETCAGARDFVKVEMQDLLLRQFSSEGVHLESAPEYHFFVYNTVKRFMDTGWYEQFGFIRELMERVEQNRVWMVHPDKTIVTVGDSEPKSVNIEWPESPDSCRDLKASCYLLRNFSESGYAIVRSDWAVPTQNASMLFFMGMFFQTGHKLPDDLSFEWFDQGERILTNAGKYSYSKGAFRDYVTSTAAHNTVEIDGRTPKLSKASRYGSAITDARAMGETFLIRGAVPREEGIEQERLVLFRPQRWLAIADVLQGDALHEYTQWFHFARQWRLENSEGDMRLVSSSGRTVLVRHLSGAQLVVPRGQKQPKLQGWVTESYGNMVDRQALGFTAVGRSVRLVTLFGFDASALDDASAAVTRYVSGPNPHMSKH
ncbi:alginate lyase family protein [Stutzerimonas stutzeri]|uniref:alginate lyase family protein n=1 Tax=Stutzerimonas stutzeri TaxID=316 RepID=UPI001CFEAEA5|nr:alginate lyase family protein [Stutzerimonas stutzeri]